MIIGWIIFSVVVGFVGSNRKVGFWGAFFLSLILSPVIGLIIALVSKDKNDEKYKNEVLKTQEAQREALEKLISTSTNNIEESTSSVADELKKMQELKESGVISKEEFDLFKSKLIHG